MGERALRVIETALLVLFFADLAVLAVAMFGNPQYFPQGGVSLILIGALGAFVHWLRGEN